MLVFVNFSMRLQLHQTLVGAAAQRSTLEGFAHVLAGYGGCTCKQCAPALALHNVGSGSLQARQVWHLNGYNIFLDMSWLGEIGHSRQAQACLLRDLALVCALTTANGSALIWATAMCLSSEL